MSLAMIIKAGKEKRNSSDLPPNLTACDSTFVIVHCIPVSKARSTDQPQMAHGTFYMVNPAVSRLLPSSDCEVLQ